MFGAPFTAAFALMYSEAFLLSSSLDQRTPLTAVLTLFALREITTILDEVSTPLTDSPLRLVDYLARQLCSIGHSER